MTTHAESNNAMLLTMEVGDYRYIETTSESYAATMRTANSPKSRRPAELAGRVFTTKLYTAVGPRVGDVVVLVRVKRIS